MKFVQSELRSKSLHVSTPTPGASRHTQASKAFKLVAEVADTIIKA